MEPYTLIIPVTFQEHPVTDITRYNAHEFEITLFDERQNANFLNKGIFHVKQYCACVFHKLFSLPKTKLKPFIHYQCDKMDQPVLWLNQLEKLIDLNRELFNEKEQHHIFEKTLILIELLKDSIETNVHVPAGRFNMAFVKDRLSELPHFEQKIAYLCELEADYQQLKPSHPARNENPFAEQVALEIEKITRQETATQKAIERIHAKSSVSKVSVSKRQSRLQLNCNLNYFVDIFFQLASEKKLIHGSLKALSEYIALGLCDKDGNPVSADSVYTMLKPSNIDKRPKEEHRYKIK